MSSRLFRHRGTCVVVLFLVLWGCSAEREPSDLFGPSQAGIPVVNAALVVGEPFPVIKLSLTTTMELPYSPEQAAIRDASVTVWSGDLAVLYALADTSVGGYLPLDRGLRVQPQTRYNLVVDLPDGARVTATTTTPEAFRVNQWVLLGLDGTVRDTLVTYLDAGDAVYDRNQLAHSDGLLEARYARDDGPGVQVVIASLDPDSDFAIDVSFLDEEDLDEFKRTESSPGLVVPDGNLRLPWSAVSFLGPYQLRVLTVDSNWFDLLLSVPDLGGGGGFGGNTGDNFETPRFHIEGGIGLFGSASVDSIGFTVLPIPQT